MSDRVELARWFRRRGLPHLVGDYRASTDVLTRAAPLLALVFVLEVLAALNAEWSWWENVAAVVAGAGIVVGAWAVVSRLQGRSPWRLPDRIGPVEVAVFVLVPPLVPLLVGGQVRAAAGVLVVNLVILALVWVVIGYALGPVLGWAVATTAHQLGDVLNLMVRSLPLLLVLTTFLFLNAEIWQVASDFPAPLFAPAVALFVGVGVAFVLIRLPRQVGAIGRFDSWSDLEPLVADTPVAGRIPAAPTGPPPHHPLGRRERLNVGVVLVFGQLVQAALVAALVGGFYVLFGLLAVRESSIALWSGGPLDPSTVLARGEWFGTEVVLTTTLLKVAGFLAAFAGLQFTVAALTDPTYREEFLDDVLGEVRQALAVRTVHLAAVAR